ncbi:hypothetical protein VTL71DRAFT_12257 [Oculimacula yallundae]|uniref:Uncharacterized protein n=1 Tax=Oculimacula yallundae TaxID=86028 RepID=A0ABR4BR09_9HELO
MAKGRSFVTFEGEGGSGGKLPSGAGYKEVLRKGLFALSKAFEGFGLSGGDY